MNRKFFSIVLVFSALCALCAGAQDASKQVGSEAPKREFRATWLTTHYSIDWPKTYITITGNNSQITKQKRSLCTILDSLQAGHLNATMLQTRPTADAFYQSSYEPWSKNLTGTRGKDPGYDPLQYAIEQAHARGIEMHAWVNPFRYEVTAGSYGNVDIRAAHPEWIISYNNGSYKGTILDPGLPEVRQYVTNVIMEMINNYDLDGMIWDDYFYPYGGTTTEDSVSKALYKPAGMSDGDWRRENVNKTIKMIYDSIQVVKPWVRFGMAPFGIWTTQKSVATQYGITLPTNITGLDDYSVQYCNTVEWVKGGYLDYIAPQIYWSTSSVHQNYTTLANWWGQSVCKHFSDMLTGGKKVHFFSANNDYSSWVNASEMQAEVQADRAAAPYDAPGCIFYNTNLFISRGLYDTLGTTCFAQQALPPAMDWKEHTVYSAPTGLTRSGDTIRWSSPATRFAVYVYRKGTLGEVVTSGKALYRMCYDHYIVLDQVDDLSQQTVAVSVFDRYGNEFAPAYWNRAASELPDTILVHVTSVTIGMDAYTMQVGGIAKLGVTIVPADADVQTVTWQSSNDSIASVDETGLVRANTCGSCVIMATTLDGGYTASCTVTVEGCTDVEELETPEANVRMILRDGHLYLVRQVNNQVLIYTPAGQVVQTEEINQ